MTTEKKQRTRKESTPRGEELKTIARIIRTLDAMPKDARDRVIAYITDAYDDVGLVIGDGVE